MVKPMRRRRHGVAQLVMIGLFGVVPFTMGGCADLQNASVDAINTAARSILNAALDAYIDQYRTN